MALRRYRPPPPGAGPGPVRKRRIVAGMLALGSVVLILLGMQWYRGHQLVDSCTGNGGQWDAERQACTFGGSGPVPDPIESAPQ